MDWQGAIDEVETREDFVSFVRLMRRDLLDRPEAWENRDLPSYLDGLAAWVEDMEGVYRNRGESVPDPPTCGSVAQMLWAAGAYE